MMPQPMLVSYTVEDIDRLARCLTETQAEFDLAVANRTYAQEIHKAAKAARDAALRDWCRAKEAVEA